MFYCKFGHFICIPEDRFYASRLPIDKCVRIGPPSHGGHFFSVDLPGTRFLDVIWIFFFGVNHCHTDY